LIASVLFPFILIPHAGLIKGGLLAGLANVGVAWVLLWVLYPEIKRLRRRLLTLTGAATILLGGGLVFADRLADKLDDALFEDPVILSKRTPYQHVAITRWKNDVRLYLNGALQFSTADEYRYHEVLVHPVMSANPLAHRVLILGGGDGMAVRELLKYETIERIDLVDLDPVITDLFRTRPDLSQLSGDALNDSRVHIHNEDAFGYLRDNEGVYDVIIADLPDPNNLSLSKLYTRQFYRLMIKRLNRSGVFVTQAASPFMTRRAFWCIVHTLESVQGRAPGSPTLDVRPYTAHVPSFGQWGFIMASQRKLDPTSLEISVSTRFLTTAKLRSLFTFGKDIAEVPTPINRLDDHALARLYRQGYERFNN
jgi:spermidine synthase